MLDTCGDPGAAPLRPRLSRGRRIYFKMMTNHVTTTIEGDEAAGSHPGLSVVDYWFLVIVTQ